MRRLDTRMSFSAVVLILLFMVWAPSTLVQGVHTEYLPLPQSFTVDFKATPLLKRALDALSREQVYPMRHANGSLYVCVVPTQTETDRLLSEAHVLSEMYKDGKTVPAAVARHVHAKLSVPRCLTAFPNGWWTYELCWSQHVLQYHRKSPTVRVDTNGIVQMDSDVAENAIVLGNVTVNRKRPAGPPARFTFGTDTKGRFIGTTYGGGSWCDVRNAPRKVHIHLYCDTDSPRLDTLLPFEVVEQDTCDYVLRLFTADLCLPELRSSGLHQTLPCYPVQSA